MFTSGKIMDFFRERLRLQFVCELPEFVEIDTGPESEGMGNRLRGRMASGHRGLTEAGANCPIHRFLEGNAELPARAVSTVRRRHRRASGLSTFPASWMHFFDVKTSPFHRQLGFCIYLCEFVAGGLLY